MLHSLISLSTGKRLLALLVATCCTAASASGYHFGTQSVSAQSTSNASTAEAADASTIFYNAAGISKLKGTQFSLNLNLLNASVKYRDAKAFYPDQTPISGSNQGQLAKSANVIPHLYASTALNERIALGLGIFVPFGSSLEYAHDSVLRYNVNKTGFKAVAVNPSLSYAINDNHSIGVGLVGQYATAELRQYANLGALVKQPNGIDGYAEVEGSDTGFGYNLGYLWDVNDDLRLGASYRSKIKHQLTGNAHWKTTHPAFANPQLTGAVRQAGYVANEKASLKIETPESISLHGMVKLTDKVTAFGDVTWTRHSRFNQMDIKYENPKVAANVARQSSGCVPGTGCRAILSDTTTIKPNWKDTVKIGLGAAYQYSDPLQLRFGLAFDETPITGPDYRLSTLPGNDRIWLSLGAKYDFDKNSSINLGYSYIHIKDASANVNGWCGSLNPTAKNCVSSRTYGQADFKSNAHLLGVQFNYKY